MNLTPIPANLCTELRIKYVRKESVATSVPPIKKAFLLSFGRKRPCTVPGTFGGTQSVRQRRVMRKLITYRRRLIEDGAN